MLYWIGIAAVFLLSWLCFRVIVRRDYLRRGSLSFFSTALEFLVFALHANLPYLYLTTPWPLIPPLPDSLIQVILGLAAVAVGLLATLAIMAQLGFDTTIGRQPDQLRQRGPYRWSRNPQLLSYGLMLVGCVVLYPSWQAAVWIVLYAAIAWLMVQTEEEHLLKLFGSQFEQYCRQVPRVISLLGKHGILFRNSVD
jgi:protein-S-isoprenylcysteine O-methyltransferase Ste14